MTQWWRNSVTIGDGMKVNSDSSWTGLHRSVEGISRQSSGMLDAAKDIAGMTVGTLNGSSTSMPVDRVSVGENASSLDDSFIDLKQSHYGYLGNLKSVKASDEAFEQLLDLAVPMGRESEQN
jgi:hypothetical protein